VIGFVVARAAQRLLGHRCADCPPAV
jgi:hypothetical protein